MGITKSISPKTTSKTTSQEIDGLLSGVGWGAWTSDWTTVTGLPQGTITYSFPNAASDYPARYGSGEPRSFAPFLSAEKAAMKSVFDNIEHVARLDFVDTTAGYTAPSGKALSDADALIRIGKAQLSNAEAWSYYPSSASEGGDAWFQKTPTAPGVPGLSYTADSLKPGGYSYTVFMHEIGHSLGLKHSFEGGKNGTVPRDSLEYTVMSYSSYERAATWFAAEGNYPQTLMQYDIAALQHMYGANLAYNAGPTTYSWTPGSGTTFVNGAAAVSPALNKIFLTIWDGGGTDEYDLSAYVTPVKIDLRAGAWTTASSAQLADLDGGAPGGSMADGNIANALLNGDPNTSRYAGLIENATGGSGADIFYANVAGNEFTGNGHDLLLDADRFMWASHEDLLNSAGGPADLIWDFQDGTDRFDLRSISGGFSLVGYTTQGNDGFVQIDLGYDRFDGPSGWSTARRSPSASPISSSVEWCPTRDAPGAHALDGWRLTGPRRDRCSGRKPYPARLYHRAQLRIAGGCPAGFGRKHRTALRGASEQVHDRA